MEAEKIPSATIDCLSVKITTATFAQPRSYFITAQCIHQNASVDDAGNASIPIYRTGASKVTKTPQFSKHKPLLIQLPVAMDLSAALETYKVVFEAYAIVSSALSSFDKSDSAKKEAKLMGESVLVLHDKKQSLLEQQCVEDVITLEGVLKIDETEKRVPIGQASITMQLTQIAQTKTDESKDKNEEKASQSPDIASGTATNSFTIKAAPSDAWPGLAHCDAVMIQVNRWWSNDIDLWPESFVHIQHSLCGEIVTASHLKSESLNFYELLRVPLEALAQSDQDNKSAPFVFKLLDEASRQLIESFAVPSTCLSVLRQYDFLFQFGTQSKTNLDCQLWFVPSRDSMQQILHEHPNMVVCQLALRALCGFENKYRYSVVVEIADMHESLSKVHANTQCIDLNASHIAWQSINDLVSTQKRGWLYFETSACEQLPSHLLFCLDDVLTSHPQQQQHQMVVKVYKHLPSDQSQSLVAFATIAIPDLEENQLSSHNYNVALLDPMTKTAMSGKELQLAIQWFTHQHAVQFWRNPTPNRSLDSHSDSRNRLLDDANTYKEVLRSPLYNGIRSQLAPNVGKTDVNVNAKKPTKRFFEAIEKELIAKQTRIETIECDQHDTQQQFELIACEMTRLKEESSRLKRLNQQLTQRLKQITEEDQYNMAHIDVLSEDKLRVMLKKFAIGHKSEKDRRKQLELVVQKLVDQLKSGKRIHLRMVKFQRAAQEQAEYIRKLRKKQREMDGYKDTIVSQEQVIERLEQMLNWTHGTVKALQGKLETGNAASSRERELEDAVIALQRENEALRKQMQSSKAKDGSHNTEEVQQLRDQLKLAEVRNDGLQNQLEENAQQFGAQIAGFKMKLKKQKRPSSGDRSVENTIDDDVLSQLSDVTTLTSHQLSEILNSVTLTETADTTSQR